MFHSSPCVRGESGAAWVSTDYLEQSALPHSARPGGDGDGLTDAVHARPMRRCPNFCRAGAGRDLAYTCSEKRGTNDTSFRTPAHCSWFACPGSPSFGSALGCQSHLPVHVLFLMLQFVNTYKQAMRARPPAQHRNRYCPRSGRMPHVIGRVLTDCRKISG
jgi:hypothetical protein